VPHSNPSKPRNPKQKQKEEFEKQTLKLKVLQFSITVISKNVESHNKVTGLRGFQIFTIPTKIQERYTKYNPQTSYTSSKLSKIKELISTFMKLNQNPRIS
jgi:hypothetical protein